MATTLFITPTDLKANSIINGNCDIDLFINFIKIAQQMHVQNYVGTKLYDVIGLKIANTTLTGEYLALVVDYIQPMLIHFAMVDYLPFASYQIRNGGVFKHRSENSETPTKEEIDILVQKHRTFADFYAKRFVDYMAINAAGMFPEYWTNSNSDMFPDQKPNPSGWVL